MPWHACCQTASSSWINIFLVVYSQLFDSLSCVIISSDYLSLAGSVISVVVFQFQFQLKFSITRFSVTIKFQLCYFSFYFSYYGDFSVSVVGLYLHNTMFDSQIKST